MKNLDSLKIASKLLKSHREKLNISIEEVSAELRLQKNIINDIENGNFKDFQSYLFLKGYLTNYANFLGVKVNLPELKILKKENSTDNNIDKDNKKIAINIPLLILLIFLTILLIYGNLYGNKIENIVAKDKKNIFFNSDPIQNPPDTLVSNNQINITENSDDLEAILTKEKSFINDTTNKELSTDVSEVINTLYIEYKLDSWTEIIDSSGNIVFFDLVKKNKSIKINISTPFEILLGDATAMIIKYNDEIIDIPYFNPDTKVVKFKIK